MRPAPARELQVLAGPGTVTAISGLTFAISDERGDIGEGPQGLIANDVRHISRLSVTVNGLPLVHLGAGLLAADTARFRGYPYLSGHGPDAAVEAARRRRVRDGGMDEELVLHSWSHQPISLTVALEVECDFADIFEVRRVPVEVSEVRGRIDPVTEPGLMRFTDAPLATDIHLRPSPDTREGNRACWEIELPPRGAWSLTVSVAVESTETETVERRLGSGSTLIATAPHVTTDPPRLMRAIRTSLEDLDALSLVDDLDPSRRLVAAGIPWFVALFGRDSLIASFQARAFAPELSVATLLALAARQGRVSDPGNGEEPGKILHEVRLTHRPWLGEGTASGARPYFGSIDATPLFLMLLGSAWRWGLSRKVVEELMPAAHAALAWMRGPGDPDGDGLLEYHAEGPRALTNQAWKDSENSVQFADGRLARPPIAMVEVQGYAYAARRAFAEVLAWLGDDAAAADLNGEADRLRDLIRARFWIEGAGEGPGYFALALDGDKRPVDAVASNMGHLLWCGVPTAAEADQVAQHLEAPDMASGWGLRTFSSAMAGYNPISYHLGSVWPHDTALACEGLRRYGHDDSAKKLASDLLDALVPFDDRLPELFGGHAREEGDFPVPYPTACRPQAWAAGVPLAMVPTCLGLVPHLHQGTISVSPFLPRSVRRLEVRGIPFPTGALSIAADEDGTHIIDAPAGIAIEVRPLRRL